MTTVKYHKCPQCPEYTHLVYNRVTKMWDYKNDYCVTQSWFRFCPFCGTQLDWDSPYTETIGDD